MDRTIEEKLAAIEEKLEENNGLLRTLILQNSSEKDEKLMQLAREKGHISAKQAEEYLQVSRTHTLTLMRRAGRHPGFKYVPGDPNTHRGGQLFYSDSKLMRDQIATTLEKLERTGVATFNDIMQIASTNLDNARAVARELVFEYAGYQIADGNKIIKAPSTRDGGISSSISNYPLTTQHNGESSRTGREGEAANTR